MDNTLRTVDKTFRIFGVLTILGLIATIAGAMNGAAWWRPVFSAAHLTALIALVPLGIALVVWAYRDAGGLGAMLSRHARIAIVLALIAVSVTITLVEFNGNRDVRRISNFTTVGLILLLIVHYFRWFRSTVGR
ncbi:MAG: hypothetical protein AB7G21_11555 [Dehalococcoidia bacterium]